MFPTLYGRLDGEGQFVFVRPAPELTITKEIVREVGSVAIRGRLAGIEVWLGDRKIGDTEMGTALVVGNLAVGSHRLKARKSGHKDWERDIQVAPNQALARSSAVGAGTTTNSSWNQRAGTTSRRTPGATTSGSAAQREPDLRAPGDPSGRGPGPAPRPAPSAAGPSTG
jgi:hypothetical protein